MCVFGNSLERPLLLELSPVLLLLLLQHKEFRALFSADAMEEMSVRAGAGVETPSLPSLLDSMNDLSPRAWLFCRHTPPPHLLLRLYRGLQSEISFISSRLLQTHMHTSVCVYIESHARDPASSRINESAKRRGNLIIIASGISYRGSSGFANIHIYVSVLERQS